MKENYIDIIKDIENKLELKESIIVAIDGRCGSGKSTLGQMLQKYFDCNLFHMDDFFVPFDLRTKDRLDIPGENVHHERFKKEIFDKILSGEDILYKKYNCMDNSFSDDINIKYKKINIIEGSYSLNHNLIDYYDYKIFLTIDKKEQLNRILKRNGKDSLNNFIEKWIPLEEKYFDYFNIKTLCDKVVDTGLK